MHVGFLLRETELAEVIADIGEVEARMRHYEPARTQHPANFR